QDHVLGHDDPPSDHQRQRRTASPAHYRRAAPMHYQAIAIRRYTLLGTADRKGEPIQAMSTRPAGSVLLWPAGSRPERFELIDVRLHDGTFAAEPVGRFEEIRQVTVSAPGRCCGASPLLPRCRSDEPRT
ncbi:hypothetical protein AB0E08_47515, partial [Streptomyces sp. NPDC048281]